MVTFGEPSSYSVCLRRYPSCADFVTAQNLRSKSKGDLFVCNELLCRIEKCVIWSDKQSYEIGPGEERAVKAMRLYLVQCNLSAAYGGV